MVACLRGLDSHRASNTANTDNWVEEDAAHTTLPVFFVSVCLVIFLNQFFTHHGMFFFSLHISFVIVFKIFHLHHIITENTRF